MKPAQFAYVRPESVAEAVAALAHSGDARVLAGGQSLVPLLNLRLAQPAVLVDIGRLRELDYVRVVDGELRCGALARQRALEEEPALAGWPLLRAAVRHIGHPATRNRGTVCGSIVHADPAAELPALLLAHDGSVVAVGPAGERVIPAAAFFLTYFTTSLGPGELVTEVRFPPLPPGSGCAFEEFSIRHGDFALCAVACALRLQGGAVAEARLALAGVAETPVRAAAAEAWLCGRPPLPSVLAEAAARVAADLAPPGDIHGDGAYRRELAALLSRRALLAAAADAALAGR